MSLTGNFDRRRRAFLGLVLLTGLGGLLLLLLALRAADVGPLAAVPLALLFALTFTWIAVSFWQALIGFLLLLTRRDPCTLQRLTPASPTSPLHPHRTVLVMPIHNEDPAAVCANLAATVRSLLAAGLAEGFEVFVLSDSRDPDLLRAEQAALAGLQAELHGRIALHYRHRGEHGGRKAGNLADFCRRWGRRYDYMLLLDTDSRMDGGTIHRLLARMQSDPSIGLLQTLPIPAGQGSAFARMLQFAAAIYSPLLAAGQAFWQGPVGNFWGHNALVRLPAFMACCGLPALPGRAPLGGEILSHDFVEAALLARAGWAVLLEPELDGSHEEVPANLIDYAARDRRWMQGNLQHLRLLGLPGLKPASRLHFLFGAASYLSSLAWLGLLLLGLAAMLLSPGAGADGGAGGWGLTLAAATLLLLFGARVMGLLLAQLRRPALFGGRLRLFASALAEALAGILLAPLMMLQHSRYALEIICGRSIGWTSPPRGQSGVPIGDALRRAGPAALLGLAWLLLAAWLTPQYLWWMSPVWLGLLLAPLLVWLSGSLRVGAALRALGLWTCPQELAPGEVLASVAPVAGDAAGLLLPPPETPGPMPLQSLQRGVADASKPLVGSRV